MTEGVVAGIDWASDVHVACVLDADGAVTDRFNFTHDSAAIRSMVRRLRAAGVAGVAIERGDGPVVEVLLDAELAVFVVPSRQIKGLRTRYGSAGNKDDRFDAYVLADTLRTDGHRWTPLRPDTGPTKALRALCRARKDLVEIRVQILEQLRSNLELALPGAIGLFTRPDSPITLAFLRRFPTARKVAWLSPARLSAWLRSVGYTGGISADVLHGRLTSAAPGLDGAEGEARGQITLALVVMLAALNDQITVWSRKSPSCSPRIPTGTSSPACPAPGRARREPARRDRRLPTAVPHRRRAAALAGRARRLASPASATRPCSVGRATRSSAPP